MESIVEIIVDMIIGLFCIKSGDEKKAGINVFKILRSILFIVGIVTLIVCFIRLIK